MRNLRTAFDKALGLKTRLRDSRGRTRRRQFRCLPVEQLEPRHLLALTINPTFGSTITSDPNAATIEATINRAIAAYESFIADNVTVNITFQESTTGLGGSSGGTVFFENYGPKSDSSSYLAHLVSHSTSANDTTAINSLPDQANDPINNQSTISVAAPLARALGFSAATSTDGTITLNTSICNLDRTSPQDSTKYDLQAVTSHEIDEILAGGSALDGQINGNAAPTGRIEPLDLYRYSAAGTRSFDANAATTSYFSIDGGATNLVGFNQYAPDANHKNDFGDWFSNNGAGATIPQVQDSNATPGATPNLNVELTRLDILGFTLNALNAPMVTAAANQTAVEGTSEAINLGSFTDPDAAPWGATVSWGDGSQSTFFLDNAGSLGTQSHNYGEEGSYKVTVTVTDFTSQVGSNTFNVAVSDPAVVQASAVPVSAVEGAAFTGAAFATFTDPGGAEPNLSDPTGTLANHYQVVSINWGDGTPLDTASGTISYSGSPGSTTDSFTVSGSHTYGEEGNYTITTVIDHEGVDTTLTSTATVSDPAVIQASVVPVSAVEGAAFTGAAFATFTDPGGAEPNSSDPSGTLANHYSVVSIDWGDGTPVDTASGTISFSGSPRSTTDPFTVGGSHTYGEEGSYTITAVIDHEGVNTTLTSTATVSDPAVLATGVPVVAVACRTLTVPVATLTDPGGAEPNPSDPTGTLANHYTATIDWGDLTPTSTGTITFGGSPGSTTDSFTVTGMHAYVTEGTYTITTTINHEGIITMVTSTATIKDDLGLLLLDPTGANSMMITGNGIVDVTGCGAAVVDSDNASSAAFVAGNGAVTAEDIDVTGAAVTHGNGSFSAPIDQEAATPDPLGLVLPAAPAATFPAVNYAGSLPLTLEPGTYVGGIKITGKGAVTLDPGIYYMQGGGFSVTGKGSLTGTNVLIVNAPRGASDKINFDGQATVTLTALTSGPDAGVTIFQDPASANPVSFAGQAALNVAGVIYAPKALVSIVGNANVTINPGPGTVATLVPPQPSINGALIAFDLKVDGNGVLTINPDPAGSVMAANKSAAAASLSGNSSRSDKAAHDFLFANYNPLLRQLTPSS